MRRGEVVSTTRYYPSGYIGLEQGAILLAKLQYPENWRTESMLPGEEKIWNGLGYLLSAEAIDYIIFCLKEDLKKKVPLLDIKPMYIRYYDFDGAIQDMRRALHAGELVGEFCDEHGKFDYVKKDGWGSDAGLDILLRGVAWLDHSPTHDVQRLIFVRESALQALAERLCPQEVTEHETARTETDTSKNKGGRPPEYNWAEIENFARSMVQKHGKPNRKNAKFSTQEDLVTLILAHCAVSDLHPSASNVRKRVSGWLSGFE